MCGIAGYIGSNAAENVVEMLRRLEYRGYDSAGVATIGGDGRIDIRKGVGYLGDVAAELGFRDMQGSTSIGHVRWATHGRVCTENSHPFLDCRGQIAIIHNGILNNCEELLGRLRGHHLTSDTDSELIAHLIEDAIGAGMPMADAVRATAKLLRGSYAIVVLSSLYPDRLVAVHHESPLVAGWAADCAMAASDYLALGVRERAQVLDLPEDEVVEIALSQPPRCRPLPPDAPAVLGKRRAHHMLDEIFEQPESFSETLRQDRDTLTTTAIDILRAKNVVFTACGSSRYAALIGRFLFSSLAGKMAQVITGSEFRYFAESLDPGSLVIAVSQSGETADVLSGVRVAKKQGAKVLSIVNRRMSKLESLSDRVLFMNCGPEFAVAATKTFTSELAVMYLLALTMASVNTKVLGSIPKAIQECLDSASRIAKVGEKISGAEHAYYIAKGINFATAGECALKLKEVSYIHAESMAAGELKHGTLSLIDKGTPVIGICPNDEMYEEMMSSLTEAKTRGAYVTGISDRENPVLDEWLRIPRTDRLYYPILAAVVGQLLAYYVSVARGLNPDRPRSLAKSVTVL